MKKELYNQILSYIDTDRGLMELSVAFRAVFYRIGPPYLLLLCWDLNNKKFESDYVTSRNLTDPKYKEDFILLKFYECNQSPRELLRDSKNFAQFIEEVKIVIKERYNEINK
jgi:hypothetical protein